MPDQAISQNEGAATAAPSPSNASGLDLVGLTKVFAGGTVAVDDVNLHVDHGEYVVLLGPSGCGKTTTLRMIGGHEFPTDGDIVLDGQSLIDLPPHKRPTTTVFQHFALFPHRSVLTNVEFGLKMHGVGKEERRKLAFEALDMVGLTPLADRKPRALSGGQQQRVALARVLVTKPKALLLDEPLGDLDRLLQLRMRVELRNLQRQLGLMFIHVTHNQEEALSMADRIVVMNEARIQQVADPLTIATKPATDLVARFMGDNNIIRGTVIEREGDRLVVEDEQHVRASVRAPGRAAGRRRPGHGLRARGCGDGRHRTAQLPRASIRPSARSSSSSSSATSSSCTCSRAASACSPRSARSSTPSCAVVRASGSGSPGRRRMSSSSTPERPGDEAARLALDEVREAEAILEQQSPQAEAALGEGRGGGGGGGWVTRGAGRARASSGSAST